MRVTLNGYVSADEDLEIYEWFNFPAFGPQTVRQAIADCPEGEDIVFEINSYGGSAFSGAEIYSVLRDSKVHTRAEIQSLAASAASYLALGCDEVWISPVAQMMIHLPSTTTEGDRHEHQSGIRALDAMTNAILNAYELKSRGKKTRQELMRMMERTEWMTAQDALEAGLVDGILYQDEPVDPKNVINALCQNGPLSPRYSPDILAMREEYNKIHRPAGDPASNTSNWQTLASQRLEIEKNRYNGGTYNV